MMQLIAWCVVQSALAVGGLTLITRSVFNSSGDVSSVVAGILTVEGVLGSLSLLLSFVVMTYILSFAQMHVYVPVNTGFTFLFTMLVSALLQGERIASRDLLGIALVLVGITILSLRQRT